MRKFKDTKKPEFFLIGAPKCGTSSLTRYLSTHPDIQFSYPKEPNYFNTDFSKKQRMFTDETLYLNQCFHKAADKNIAGEGSVWYLYSKEAVPNILKFQPDAKFIVMLRNPVDVAYAMHSTHLRNKVNENVDDFKKAWDLQEIRMQGEHLAPDCRDPKLVQYKEIAMFGKQIKRLFNQVDKNQVKIILFEDFIQDTKMVYEEVLEFLGLESDNRNTFPVINENKYAKSKTVSKIISKAGRSTPWILFIKSRLGIPKRKSILRFISRLNKTPKKRKPLAPEFRKHLVNEFKNDVLLLQSLINRDLSHWLD